MGRPVDPAVLQDLHSWGADTLANFQSRVGEATTAKLVLDGSIKVRTGHTFNYVALGPQGRKHLGLHPNHTVEPSAAARHIMRREAKAKLEQLGMTYEGAEDRILRRFTDTEGKVYFLAASVKPNTAGYTARAVRRLLSRYQTLLLQTRGILIVATPHPGRLARTVAKHEGYVKTLKVDGSIRKVGN